MDENSVVAVVYLKFGSCRVFLNVENATSKFHTYQTRENVHPTLNQRHLKIDI